MPHKLILLLAAALLVIALPSPSQQFIPKSIQFKGDPGHSTDDLMAAAGLKKGAVLTSVQMNEASKRLVDSGMFATLTFKFDGQDLIFLLTPSDQLLSVHLDNLPFASGTDVEAKLHQEFPLYHGNLPSEGEMTEQVRGSVEKLLAEQGIKATVLATPASDPKTHRVNSIHFSIVSPPVQIRIAQIDGESAEFAEKLQDVSKEAAKLSFDMENSASSIEGLFDLFYRDRGYAAVKVEAKRAGEVASDSAGIVVPFAVTIHEGHVYKIGTVHLPDNAPVTPAEIAKTLGVTPNGPIEGVRVRSLWELVASRYHSKGYLDCRITPSPVFDEATTTVNYDVAVDPGPVYHLAFVKFDNVSDQLRALLMKNWQMLPGDVFNEAYVAGFFMAIQQNDPVLRRSLAGVKYNFDVTADPQSHSVNVVIRLAKQ